MTPGPELMDAAQLRQTIDLDRFWSKVDKSSGPDACWTWSGGRRAKGYGAFFHQNKMLAAHRVAFQLNGGSIPSGLLVCHRCDNPPCVNPAHLFLGTVRDNALDMLRKGRFAALRGEANPRSKLTADVVRNIIRRAQDGELGVSIAKDIGVHCSVVHAILAGRRWKHITGGKPVSLNAEQLNTTLDRLRRLRHRITQTAVPAADGSLVPLLTASAEVCAIDNAVRLLERELKAALQ